MIELNVNKLKISRNHGLEKNIHQVHFSLSSRKIYNNNHQNKDLLL